MMSRAGELRADIAAGRRSITTPRSLVLLGAVILLVVFPSVAAASPGDLDPSFSGDGIAYGASSGGGSAIRVDSSGRIVVLGVDNVMRFRPGGRLDKSFSGDGIAPIPFDGYADSIAIDAKDRIVVGGEAPNPGDPHHRGIFAVGRLKPNGNPDPSFSGNGRVVTPIGGAGPDQVRAVAIDRQGRIVAVGMRGSYYGNTGWAVARYLGNGSPDTSFSGDGQTQTKFQGNGAAAGVAIDSNGRIVVAGGAAGLLAVARYTSAGNLDPSFSQDGIQTTDVSPPGGEWFHVSSVAIDDRGRIVVGGDRYGAEFVFVRYRPNGALDPGFSGDGKAFAWFGPDWDTSLAYGLGIDDHGRIVASGNVWHDTPSGTHVAFALVRLTPSGALDSGFGNGGLVTTSIGREAWGGGLALDSQGRILVAGAAKGHTAVARYLG